jgi:serine/threonine protein kinase
MKPGEVVARRFEIVRFVGSGGWGHVYRARDRRTGDRIALKLLRATGYAASRRFAREVHVLQRLEHPAIVRYVAHGHRRDGQLFLAMEWLDGQSLKMRLLRGPLSLKDTLTLFERIADALAFVHARGVVHRDVTPGNVFLVDYNVHKAKLLDFGLARFDGEQTLTRVDQRIGTLGYMAPEIATNHDDPQLDVYSLGCLAYECLTGQPAQAIDAKGEAQHPLTPLSPGIPPELDWLVQRMLAHDPKQRPKNGAEVAEQLAFVRARLTDRPTTPERLPEPAKAESSSHRLLVSAMVGRDAPSRTRKRVESIHHRPKLLQPIAAAYGGSIALVAGELVVIGVEGQGTDEDLAIRAVGCAAALRSMLPSARIAIGSGPPKAEPLSVPEVVETMAPLLEDRTGDLEPPTLLRIRVDTGAERLLAGRFAAERTGERTYILLGA